MYGVGNPNIYDVTAVPLGELPGCKEMPSTTDLQGAFCLGPVSSSVKALPHQAQLPIRPSQQAVAMQSSRMRRTGLHFRGSSSST